MTKHFVGTALAAVFACAQLQAHAQSVPFTFATQQGGVPARELDANFAAGELIARKGVANGYAGLDATGHLPVATVPMATTSSAGAVLPDGASILNNNGLISVTPASVGALNKAGDTATGLLKGVAPGYGDNSPNLQTTAWAAAQTPCKEIDRYGADPTGQADSTSAFNAAVAAAQQSERVCVAFGTGLYTFNSQLSVTLAATRPYASVTLVGQGPDMTKLTWPTNGGVALGFTTRTQNFALKNMTLLAGSTGQGNPGLSLSFTASNAPTQAISTIEDVNFRGNDGYAAAGYWSAAVSDDGLSNINVVNVNFTGSGTNPIAAGYAQLGTGFTAFSSGTGANATTPVQFNFFGCNFTYLQYGIHMGYNSQGYQVASSNFVGGLYGIYSGPSDVNLDQLSVTGSQFNDIYDIAEYSWVPTTMLMGNSFGCAAPASSVAGQCLILQQAGYFVVTGNEFTSGSSQYGTYGVVVGNTVGSDSGIISNNTFMSFAQNAAIYLQTNANHVQVNDNQYQACSATCVIDQGTNDTIAATVYGGAGGLSLAKLNALDPSPLVGDRAFITDATSCPFMTAKITGGGSAPCSVIYVGGQWYGG